MDTNRWHRSIEEHRAALLATALPLPALRVDIDGALGLVCDEQVCASISLPSAAVSAMDGFAVHHEDVAVDAVLPVQMDIPAGSVGPEPLLPGHAARIMTGAVLPQGADTVVAVELTDIPRGPVPLPEQITVRQVVPFADAVRDAGSDVRAGQEVLARGALVDTGAVAALAAVGCAHVSAVPAPRVRVVSTGAEIRQPGQPLQPGQIYDSNSHMLAAFVRRLGLPVERVALEHDDPHALGEGLVRLADGVDALVFAGGVSAGAFEVVRQALSARGVEFGTVAMQPGKPQGFGFLDGGPTAVFCLPGNPVSAAVSFVAFAAPWLEARAGRTPTPWVEVLVDDEWAKKPGRAQFMPVTIVDGVARRRSPEGSQSHLVTRLVGVDGFLHVPADLAQVRRGDHLSVMMVP